MSSMKLLLSLSLALLVGSFTITAGGKSSNVFAQLPPGMIIPTPEQTNAVIMADDKQTLDKCTPLAAHMNTNLTIPDEINYGKNKTTSCKEAMKDIGISSSCGPNTFHDTLYRGIYDNDSKMFSHICKDPRYLNWLNRYVRSHDVTVLQVLSDIHWSGSYGDSTGSTSIDGQGNRNITLSCHNGDDTGFYSALFSKKGENGFVTLNVIQNTSELYEPPQVVSTHTTNAAYGSISASGQC